MTRSEIRRYFRILSRFFRSPCLIILTGAAAGAVYGGLRPTMDVDFALKLKARGRAEKEKLWHEFDEAARRATRLTGINAQYAEDIDRWSSITFLDYEHHTLAFERFAKMSLRVLEPSYWAIGKITRYIDTDVRDLISVLKKTKTPWRKLVRISGLALRKSPRSTACFQFRRQFEDFLRTYARQIWGNAFPARKAIQMFHRYAGIQAS